jgi:hypothetical protein
VKLFSGLFRKLIWLLLIGLYWTPSVENDGCTYYALTRSLVRDRDFDISADPISHIPGRLRLAAYPGMQDERPIFSGGFALGYYPFLALAPKSFPARFLMANLSEYKSEVPRADAFAIALGSLFFGLLAVSFSRKLARGSDHIALLEDDKDRKKEIKRGRRAAAWAGLLVFAGTPLMHYTLSDPSFSHAIDACALSVALYALWRARSVHAPLTWIFISGMASGASVCIRNVNFPLAVCLAIAAIFLPPAKSSSATSVFARIPAFLAGFSPFAGFQLIYNAHQYGNMMTWGYSQSGASELHSNLISMLFSYTRGYFVWSPVAGLAIAGLILLFFRDKWLSIVSLSLIAAFFGTAQFFPHWTGGASFGLRFAALLAAPLTAGLAEFLKKTRLAGMLLALPLAGFALALDTCFILPQHSPTGLKAMEIASSNFTPSDLTRITKEEYSASKESNPVNFVWKRLGEGHVPCLFPNLAASALAPGAAFVNSISGRIDDKNKNKIDGELSLYSFSDAETILNLSFWPFVDAGREQSYSYDRKAGVFNLPVKTAKGINRYRWVLDLRGSWAVWLSGASEPQYAEQRLWVPGYELLPELHIEAGAFSQDVPRVMGMDVRQEK